jgi:hypothetical protein
VQRSPSCASARRTQAAPVIQWITWDAVVNAHGVEFNAGRDRGDAALLPDVLGLVCMLHLKNCTMMTHAPLPARPAG